MEKTFAMIKPDAVSRGLTGTIIERIEKEGFEIVAMKKATFSRAVVENFYAEHVGKGFFEEMAGEIMQGPSVLLVLQRDNGIKAWRDLMGATNPADAAQGTIRKLHAKSIGQNSVHGSDAPASAEREIGLMFPDLATVTIL